MPQVIVNGQVTDLVEKNLAKFVAMKTKEGTQIAVAVNEEFIPKAEYENTELREGDRIELVTPMQGG